MQITDVKISLIGGGRQNGLAAYCAVTFDDVFVVRDIRVVILDGRIIVSMPERKIQAQCPWCRERNQLKALYCNFCGNDLVPPEPTEEGPIRYMVDVVHPISRDFRCVIERLVLDAYNRARRIIPPSTDK